MAFSRKPTSLKSSGNGCLLLFGLPFLTAGLFLSGLYFKTLGSWWSAQSWVEVPCVIDRAELKTSSDSDSTTYKAEAEYHYQYEGKKYQSSTVTHTMGSDNVSSFQHDAAVELKRYAQNRQPFRCYVNPQHPDQAMLYRNLRLGLVMLIIAFPLIFPAVGAGIMVAAWWHGRNEKAEAKLREEHPEEPWRWKTAWTGESLKSWNASRILFLYVAWAGLHILPLIFACVFSEILFTKSGLLILPLLLVWGVPAWFALRHLRQQLVAGEIIFKPETWPISQSAGLRGQVMFSRPFSLRNPIEITISCAKETVRKTSDGDSKQSEPLWSSTEVIDAGRATCDLSGTRLPLSIALPRDAPDATLDDEGGNYVWKLKVHSKVPRISASFDLPVFETAVEHEVASLMPDTDVPVSLHQAADDNLEENLRVAGLQVSFTPDGMPQRLVCPPRRHRNLIRFLVIFDLIWTGACIFLLKSDAPTLFPVVWGVSSMAIWLFIFSLVLGRQSATFTRDGVEIESEMKGLWRRRKFHARNTLLYFTCATNMSSGNTSYYTVKLTAMSGLKGKVADAIASSATAEALVRRLEKWRTQS